VVDFYVPKVEAVEALQYTGDNLDEVKTFLDNHHTQYSHDVLGSAGELVVYSYTGPVFCRASHWVYYSSTASATCNVMPDDLFKKRFEKKNGN
jgi:hypothetical protein